MVDAVSSGSAANVQSQIATQALKQNIASERSSVLQLLEPAAQSSSSSASSSANLEAGVGGNVDKSA